MAKQLRDVIADIKDLVDGTDPWDAGARWALKEVLKRTADEPSNGMAPRAADSDVTHALICPECDIDRAQAVCSVYPHCPGGRRTSG